MGLLLSEIVVVGASWVDRCSQRALFKISFYSLLCRCFSVLLCLLLSGVLSSSSICCVSSFLCPGVLFRVMLCCLSVVIKSSWFDAPLSSVACCLSLRSSLCPVCRVFACGVVRVSSFAPRFFPLAFALLCCVVGFFVRGFFGVFSRAWWWWCSSVLLVEYWFRACRWCC